MALLPLHCYAGHAFLLFAVLSLKHIPTFVPLHSILVRHIYFVHAAPKNEPNKISYYSSSGKYHVQVRDSGTLHALIFYFSVLVFGLQTHEATKTNKEINTFFVIKRLSSWLTRYLKGLEMLLLWLKFAIILARIQKYLFALLSTSYECNKLFCFRWKRECCKIWKWKFQKKVFFFNKQIFLI